MEAIDALHCSFSVESNQKVSWFSLLGKTSTPNICTHRLLCIPWPMGFETLEYCQTERHRDKKDMFCITKTGYQSLRDEVRCPAFVGAWSVPLEDFQRKLQYFIFQHKSHHSKQTQWTSISLTLYIPSISSSHAILTLSSRISRSGIFWFFFVVEQGTSLFVGQKLC